MMPPPIVAVPSDDRSALCPPAAVPLPLSPDAEHRSYY
jgi:hypothetical protein